MSNGTVWKVAIGVYLGGMSVVFSTLLILAALGQIAMKRSEAAGEAIAREFLRSTPKPHAQYRTESNAARALHAGHRCINGQVFRRVENGWEQVGSTCPP